jgi:hypothetical protein
MQEVYYDRKEQLQKLQAALLPGETPQAVYDMKGEIGITSPKARRPSRRSPKG